MMYYLLKNVLVDPNRLIVLCDTDHLSHIKVAFFMIGIQTKIVYDISVLSTSNQITINKITS